MEQDPLLPDEAFALTAELYPAFMWVLRVSELSGLEFFLLSFIRRSQVSYEGHAARLYGELRHAFQRVLGKSATHASTVIGDLHTRGLIRKFDISTAERQRYFGQYPDPGGRNTIVYLTDDGKKILNQLNDRVDEIARRLLSRARVPHALVRIVLRRFQRVSGSLVTAAHEEARLLWAEMLAAPAADGGEPASDK